MEQYKKYQEAQRNLAEASEWLARISKKGGNGDAAPRTICAVHSSIKFTTPIQYGRGDTNYWDSPAALNFALLQVLIETDLGAQVRDAAYILMANKMREALLASEAELKAALQQIEAAK